MKRSMLALALVSFSIVASAADKPLPVTVANPVLPVEVSNADPIPVLPTTPSEIPANRYQISLSVDTWTDSGVGSSYITISGSSLAIPSDKILVLEFVYSEARVNPGDKANLEITCQGASSTIGLANVRVPLAAAGIFGGRESLIGGGATMCYSGSSMIISLLRDSAVPAGSIRSGQISLVGYLIDKPQ